MWKNWNVTSWCLKVLTRIFFLFLSFIAFNNCDYICIACYLNGNYIYSSTGVKQDISRGLTVRSLNSKKFWGLSMFIEIEDYKTIVIKKEDQTINQVSTLLTNIQRFGEKYLNVILTRDSIRFKNLKWFKSLWEYLQNFTNVFVIVLNIIFHGNIFSPLNSKHFVIQNFSLLHNYEITRHITHLKNEKCTEILRIDFEIKNWLL